MTGRNAVLGTLCLAGLIALHGCRSADSGHATLEEGLVLFQQNRLEEALPVFKRVVSTETDLAEAHIWLAETYRRLHNHGKAIEHAQTALDAEPCNSFALTVIADASVPQTAETDIAKSETSWKYLMKAIECDSTDGNVWESVWGFAIRRDDPGMVQRSVRRMVETGFLTDAALDFGRWLLTTLPDGAVLLTNGDMDTYPSMAVQETENLRPDVAIVERALLNAPWGIRFYRDHLRVQIPFPDAALDTLMPKRAADGSVIHPADLIFERWVDECRNRSAPRPIALAVTVYRDFFDQFENDVQYDGPFWLVLGKPVTHSRDTVALRQSLAGLAPDDFDGPWVSEQDYSPVRGLYTKEIVTTVTHSALVYAEELLDAGRLDEAENTVSWAEDFEKRTELGPAYVDRIAEIRGRIDEGRGL